MISKNTKQEVMTVADLKQLLAKLSKEVEDNFDIWLSSDEEGNDFLPMLKDTRLSLSIDKKARRIIFFPSHR
jgi:hypothetical protein